MWLLQKDAPLQGEEPGHEPLVLKLGAVRVRVTVTHVMTMTLTQWSMSDVSPGRV